MFEIIKEDHKHRRATSCLGVGEGLCRDRHTGPPHVPFSLHTLQVPHASSSASLTSAISALLCQALMLFSRSVTAIAVCT